MGEPFLNPECTRMIRYAHQNGHREKVFTTAVGMSRDDVAALVDIPFIEFALHLPSAEGYERITIDETYLSVLRYLLDSGIVTSLRCHGETVNPLVQYIVNEPVGRRRLNTRAGNIRLDTTGEPRRKRGRLLCTRNLDQNVLFPNGDVVLCCMDFGMKHVIGNLVRDDYDGLFSNEEFLFVQRGLDNPSLDILCRFCELAREDSLSRKARNQLRSIRTPSDLFRIVPRCARYGIRQLRSGRITAGSGHVSHLRDS